MFFLKKSLILHFESFWPRKAGGIEKKVSWLFNNWHSEVLGAQAKMPHAGDCLKKTRREQNGLTFLKNFVDKAESNHG